MYCLRMHKLLAPTKRHIYIVLVLLVIFGGLICLVFNRIFADSFGLKFEKHVFWIKVINAK